MKPVDQINNGEDSSDLEECKTKEEFQRMNGRKQISKDEEEELEEEEHKIKNKEDGNLSVKRLMRISMM